MRQAIMLDEEDLKRMTTGAGLTISGITGEIILIYGKRSENGTGPVKAPRRRPPGTFKCKCGFSSDLEQGLRMHLMRYRSMRKRGHKAVTK